MARAWGIVRICQKIAFKNKCWGNAGQQVPASQDQKKAEVFRFRIRKLANYTYIYRSTRSGGLGKLMKNQKARLYLTHLAFQFVLSRYIYIYVWYFSVVADIHIVHKVGQILCELSNKQTLLYKLRDKRLWLRPTYILFSYSPTPHHTTPPPHLPAGLWIWGHLMRLQFYITHITRRLRSPPLRPHSPLYSELKRCV